MRAVALILAVLLLLLQYPLWLGKGGWLKVWDMNRQVEAQQQGKQKNPAAAAPAGCVLPVELNPNYPLGENE